VPNYAGAAPGGWTLRLSRQSDTVIAVDPAQLSTSAQKGNVVHLQCKAQGALPSIAEYGPADILVCDMNHHLCDTLPAVLELMPCVTSGGFVILTLKFFGVGRCRTRWIQKLTRDLQPHVELLHVLWLHANTVNERTLIAQRT
jgi:hypothetical protein